ncbi:hypothetical protein [Stutzerimonas nitrititolerans]|uniref:hypothetical protein n=2 Tax=Pseudomonadales TaxID=72274 RepID=UPI0028B0320E|nr:hypothetical protein [Stutzerimonas nitrititolerans]
MIWGGPMAIQGLPPEARGLMWWLVGGHKRTQLELFHLNNPVQRPQPRDWRCCDLGWSRFGIAMRDLDVARATLAQWQIPISAELTDSDGTRRLAFRDPFIGCFVELIEGYALVADASAPRHPDIDPTIVYATHSVSDLQAARSYYADTLEQEISEVNQLHGPQHEVLWGLDGARSESFLVRGGSFVVEVVQYLDPLGRPVPEEYCVADQGLLNVALASYERDAAERVLHRIESAGYRSAQRITMGSACGAYVLEPELMVEVCAIPEELEPAFGFTPVAPFFGQQG